MQLASNIKQALENAKNTLSRPAYIYDGVFIPDGEEVVITVRYDKQGKEPIGFFDSTSGMYKFPIHPYRLFEALNISSSRVEIIKDLRFYFSLVSVKGQKIWYLYQILDDDKILAPAKWCSISKPSKNIYNVWDLKVQHCDLLVTDENTLEEKSSDSPEQPKETIHGRWLWMPRHPFLLQRPFTWFSINNNKSKTYDKDINSTPLKDSKG